MRRLHLCKVIKESCTTPPSLHFVLLYRTYLEKEAFPTRARRSHTARRRRRWKCWRMKGRVEGGTKKYCWTFPPRPDGTGLAARVVFNTIKDQIREHKGTTPPLHQRCAINANLLMGSPSGVSVGGGIWNCTSCLGRGGGGLCSAIQDGF